ncbi:outer membrane beta-barrel protein [Mucilaginibacter sp. UR6-1]|uniref:outer membrane beta-barrel family protein n=1 Tax=Mucilaginibacter sp. UR6-1 TaxID=1435643 RepID=UPI001E335A18|nr:outer membrane beta-barrel family protein [Mucilaginibacter sp. UR6-1]MCC8409091.1 outer membrane beta-barrel protein [Mucilaginibacter sp. UR6-1]
MNQIPGVSTATGEIKLLGDNRISVLIDGKPSSLSGRDLTNYLQQIQASNIESINVFTIPPSNYDANGSGVIDIITKKKKDAGYTVSLNSGIATHDKQNASATLNFNTIELTSYLKFSYDHYNERYKEEESYNIKNSSLERYDYKFKYDDQPWNTYLVDGGLNYSINPLNNIGLKFTASKYDGSYLSEGRTDYFSEGGSLSRSELQNQYRNVDINSKSINLNYRKPYKKPGKDLTLEANYYNGNRNENNDIIFDNQGSADSSIFQYNNTRTNVYYLKGDYRNPLSKTLNLQLGFKSGMADIDNKNDVGSNIGLDSIQYSEFVNAIYSSLRIINNKFSYNIGLRLEHTHSKLDAPNQPKILRNYLNAFPNLNIIYTYSQASSYSLSATRRIVRPKYNQLNPFIDKTNVTTYEAGNPYLSPYFSYNFELSYNYQKNKHSFYTSLGTRLYRNIIDKITSPYGNSSTIFINTPQNLNNSSYNYLTAYYKNTISAKVDASLNLSGYNITYGSSDLIQVDPKSIYTLNGAFNLNFNFFKNTYSQLTFNFQTPQTTPQGKANSYYYGDFTIGKSFLKNALYVNIILNDVLNTNKNKFSYIDPNFTKTGYFKVESQILWLSVSYSFGKSFKSRATRFNPERDIRNSIIK